MTRVAVIGSGGAGKSTFAKELGARLDLPVVHLDHLYWRPGWVPTPPQEWRALQARVVSEPRWIIDGNYGGTFDLRLPAADVVVFFDMPRRVALLGALRRSLRGRGREVQAPGCPERLDLEFLRWIWRFPHDTRPRVMAALREHASSAEVLVVRSRREGRRALERLAAMRASGSSGARPQALRN